MNTKVKKISQIFFLASLFFTSTQQCSAGLWESTGEYLRQSGEFLWQLGRHPGQFFTAQTNYLLAPNQVLPRTAATEIKYQDEKITLINKQTKEIAAKINGVNGWFSRTPGLDPEKDANQVATLQKAGVCLEEAKANAEQIKILLNHAYDFTATHDSIATHGVQKQQDAQYLDKFTRLKRQGTEDLDQCLSNLAKDSEKVSEYQKAFSDDTQEVAQLAGNWETQKFAIRYALEKIFANPYAKAAGIVAGTAAVTAVTYKSYRGLLYLYRWTKGIREIDIDREINRLTTEIATKSTEIQNILEPPAPAAGGAPAPVAHHPNLDAHAIAGIAQRREQITTLTRHLDRLLRIKENCKKWFPWVPFITTPYINPIA